MSKNNSKAKTINKKQKNNDEKVNMLNIIIIVITAVSIAVLVSATIIMTKINEDKTSQNIEKNTGKDDINDDINVNDTASAETQPEALSQHGMDSENPLNYITTYKTKDTGTTVSEAESKTLAYFNSHYKDDYYKVSEISHSEIDENGNYTEYYETITTAYSKDGYLYRKNCLAPYEEQDYTSADIFLYTPESAYRIMPDMKSYFMGEGNTQGYTNTIDFPTDTFEIKTVNIYGREYYCEEYSEIYTDPNDESKSIIVTYQYCFDETDDLRYVITSTPSATITERYIEYSKDVDYSLFEIPEDYMLVQ